MRVNFNGATSRRTGWNSGRHAGPPWLDQMVCDFCRDHDMVATEPEVIRFMRSHEGVRLPVQWLAHQGFQIGYWEIECKDRENPH